MSEGFNCLILSWGLGRGVGVRDVMWIRSSVPGTNWSELLGECKPKLGKWGDSVPQEARLDGSPQRVIFQPGLEGGRAGGAGRTVPRSAQARDLCCWALRRRSVAWKTRFWSDKELGRAPRPQKPPNLLLRFKGQLGSHYPGSVPAGRPPAGHEATGPRRAPVSLLPHSSGLGVTVNTWRGSRND